MKKVILGAMMMLAAGTANAADIKLPEHTANGGMPLMEAIAARRSGRTFDTKMLSDQVFGRFAVGNMGNFFRRRQTRCPDGAQPAGYRPVCPAAHRFLPLRRGKEHAGSARQRRPAPDSGKRAEIRGRCAGSPAVCYQRQEIRRNARRVNVPKRQFVLRFSRAEMRRPRPV